MQSNQPEHLPTKAELLERIAHGRAALEAMTGKLSDAQLTTPGKDGWTIQDHLVHLAAWESGIAALLRHESRWQAMGVQDLVRADDFDSINAKIRELHQQRTLQETRDYFRQTHLDLLAALGALSDADLLKPYAHYQPDAPRDGDANPILNWIAGNTFGHYEEHIEWIRAWVGLK